MRFTLKQIEYFVAAGETGSITLASERVHISQPSISAAISQLEQAFGFQLFIRHHAQGLSLTSQGTHFLREAKNLLLQAEELNAIAAALSGKVTGSLEIGCLSTLYPLLAPELVHAFQARFATARIQARAGNQASLIADLRRGDITLALGYDFAIPADIGFEMLASLPPFVFLAADHPLARHPSTRRHGVSLREMAEEPLLLLDRPDSRDYCLSLFHGRSLAPNLFGTFEHMDAIRSLAARGDGYGIGHVRPRNMASLEGLPLAYLAIEDPTPPLPLGLMALKGLRHTRMAEAFIDFCREFVNAGHLPGTSTS
ncbi:MAG TPA: LysR family transcriptional regulator [Stellaceae bacterium]|nr:LysR family transcriptional regulator [Stellaceae bacterium]